MNNITIHVGRVTSTDQKIVTVFNQLPGDNNSALVIPMDTLPDRYHQAVTDICLSKEGQSARNLADVLSRRMFEDTGQNVLEHLHARGLLAKMPIDNITMYPAQGMEGIPLRTILHKIGANVSPLPDPGDTSGERYNQFAENQKADARADATGAAQNLLLQASLLEEDAQRKREQAYRLQPNLRPFAAAVSAAPTPGDPAAQVVPIETTARNTVKKTAAKKPTAKRAPKKVSG